MGLSQYFVEYNCDRSLSTLDIKTFNEFYLSSSGGGKMVLGNYSDKVGISVAPCSGRNKI